MSLRSFWDWLITSSADPRSSSLAIKGLLAVLGDYVLHALTAACAFALYCTGIDVVWINNVVQTLSDIAYGALIIVGAAVSLIGIARKLWLGRWSHPTPR